MYLPPHCASNSYVLFDDKVVYRSCKHWTVVIEILKMRQKEYLTFKCIKKIFSFLRYNKLLHYRDFT